MRKTALSHIRYFFWAFGLDPARWMWFRSLYSGRWEHWWIGSPVNSDIWIDGLKKGERPGLGERCFKREEYEG